VEQPGQLQRYPEALAAFTRAVGPAQGQCNLAFIYSTQGQHGKAREAWQKALELEPALQVARAALAKLDAADRKAVPPPEGADPERPRPPADRSAALTRLVNFVRDQEGQAPSSANGPDTAAAPTLSVAPKTEDAAETRPTPRKRTVIKPIPVPCSP
jgi:tetratricopeptide (TPR) repeat protein